MAVAIAELENVTVRFRGEKVLGPLNLKIEQNDFFGVVGPNGAGKSTFLKVLAGLHRVSEGSVIVFGQSFAGGSRNSIKSVRKNIGMLMQHHLFYPDLPFTVEDVIFFGRAGLRGLGRRYSPFDIETVNNVISELNLEYLRHRLYRELSGGECRKVQLARLLAQQSELLLLDEPAAGLDLDWQEKVTQLVANLYDRFGKTIIMVTHDVDRLPECCNRVLLLRNGNVLAKGAPSEVLRADVLSNLYGCTIEVAERKGRFHAYSLGLKEAR